MKGTRSGFVLIGIIAFVLTSCSRDKICDCIEVGDTLNKKSAEVLSKINPSKEDAKVLKELREKKKATCKEFETMGGPEMMERKASCE